jgi:hypothetical protein
MYMLTGPIETPSTSMSLIAYPSQGRMTNILLRPEPTESREEGVMMPPCPEVP